MNYLAQTTSYTRHRTLIQFALLNYLAPAPHSLPNITSYPKGMIYAHGCGIIYKYLLRITSYTHKYLIAERLFFCEKPNFQKCITDRSEAKGRSNIATARMRYSNLQQTVSFFGCLREEILSSEGCSGRQTCQTPTDNRQNRHRKSQMPSIFHTVARTNKVFSAIQPFLGQLPERGFLLRIFSFVMIRSCNDI